MIKKLIMPTIKALYDTHKEGFEYRGAGRLFLDGGSAHHVPIGRLFGYFKTKDKKGFIACADEIFVGLTEKGIAAAKEQENK